MKKLTLFGREFEFFWGKRKASTGPIEIWPFLLIAIFFSFFVVSDAYDSWKGTMTIPVMTHVEQFSVRKEFALPGNNVFVPGGSTGPFSSDNIGALVWHPQSLWQALVLEMTRTGSLNFMDIFHLCLLYLYILVFYLMTRQGKDTINFSKKISKGFRYIFFMIAMTGPLEYEKYKLTNNYLQHITNGQFRLAEETIHYWYYFYIGIMLIVLSRFTDKAAELQKETELTI